MLSRGDKFVFAQNIGQVVEFLKLDEKTGPVLSPAQLIARLELFLDTALRIVPQMPDDKLEVLVPNRPRSYRVLGHHMFRIAEAFVEAAEGAPLTYELTTIPPPPGMTTTADIAAYGRGARDRLATWWATTPDKAAHATIQTYYGPQRLHDVLERTTWHVGQHVRQWVMLLQMNGVAADRPPAEADFADLPMPKSVWDG